MLRRFAQMRELLFKSDGRTRLPVPADCGERASGTSRLGREALRLRVVARSVGSARTECPRLSRAGAIGVAPMRMGVDRLADPFVPGMRLAKGQRLEPLEIEQEA